MKQRVLLQIDKSNVFVFIEPHPMSIPSNKEHSQQIDQKLENILKLDISDILKSVNQPISYIIVNKALTSLSSL